MITYKLTLRCSRCGCDVTYENEKPKWRRDNKIIDALNIARKFVAKNPKVARIYLHAPFKVPDYVGTITVGTNLMASYFEADTFVEYVEFHFVDCPACVSGRCYLGSGMKD